jgi:hypothetical protein
MQVVQAGPHKYLLLELEADVLLSIAQQSGFECKLEESSLALALELTARGRELPLLLFDAADPANLGWFSRCQFYVDGRTGVVLQTPLAIANQKDPGGRLLPNSIRLRLAKELPVSFRMPGKNAVSEQSVYAVLFNFLNALTSTGVGVCGGPVVKPLAGRVEGAGPRN